MLQHFKDTPFADKVPEFERNKIMHVSLPILKDTILMATDATESMVQKLTTGNNFSLCISTDFKEDADKYFAALSEGGKITMALENTFWGAYFGMATDKFDIQWMISYDERVPGN